MGIIAWIVFGLIAGVIAKLLMPGRDGGGFILTCILGIVGAVVGAGWRPCSALAAASAVLICTVSSSRWWAPLWCWVFSGLYGATNPRHNGSCGSRCFMRKNIP